MKKKQLVKRTISSSLLFLLIFLLLLLLLSMNWFVANFGEVDISVAIYQLLSPLEGTDTGVIRRYCTQCLLPSILGGFCITLLYNLDRIFEKLSFEFQIQCFVKKFSIRTDKMCAGLFHGKRVIFGIILIALCAGVSQRAILIGVPDYIASVTHSSTIFEEEYMDPATVTILFPKQKRNLILIYMESMEATYSSVEDGGGKPYNYIPELTQMAKDYINFSNDGDLGGAATCPDTGWTMGGLFSSVTGVPYKIPGDGNDAGEMGEYLPGILSLGDVLEQAGYENYFMCGSNAAFGGRAAFYTQHGDYQILDYGSAKKDGIIPEDYSVYWGMEDAKLYEYAKTKLTEIASEAEPFNFTMLTVDTHATDGYFCSLCENQYAEQYANALACASRQVWEFVEWAKEQEWYENTTIVITGDHISMKADFWDDIGDYDRKIYNCFVNVPEEIEYEQRTNRDFTILDMFPTILTAMDVQIEGNRLGLGTNLFSTEPTLLEKMGWETYENELKLNSNYYYNFMIDRT